MKKRAKRKRREADPNQRARAMIDAISARTEASGNPKPMPERVVRLAANRHQKGK